MRHSFKQTLARILVLTMFLMCTGILNVVPAVASEETNLIANPGFEDSATDYSPWIFEGPDGADAVLETENLGSTTQANNIRITEPGAGTAYIKQTVSVDPNTDYLLTCSVQGDGTSSLAGLGVNTVETDKLLNVAYGTPTTEYKTIYVKFNSGDSSAVTVYGSFQGAGADSTCRFDDFSLTTTTIEQPSENALFSKSDWLPGMISLGTENTVSPITIEMDIIPLYVGSPYDATIGYADSSKVFISHWQECGVMLRFNAQGYIDARNGGDYSFAEKLYFSAYKKYHAKIVVDLVAKRYDAYITPEDGAEVKVADNFAFRTESMDMDDIGWLSLKSTVDNQFYVENHVINGIPVGTPRPTPTPREGPVVLRVGPGKEYPTPQLAFNDAQPGDTIEIYADGVYFGDNAKLLISGKDNIRIVGVPAGGNTRPKMELTDDHVALQSKGIWVVSANNITIENIEFCGATRVKEGITDPSSRNASGIRVEPIQNLVIKNCYIHDNDMGILSASVDSTLTLEHNEFARNGYAGYSHNAYIQTKNLFFRYNYSHHAKGGGHLLKTRAEYNYIEYNRLTDEDATETYKSNSNIDIPDAGIAYVIGNIMHQATIYDNSRMLSYGVEQAKNAGKELYVINNTFVNDHNTGTFIQCGRIPATVVYKNNIFNGAGAITGIGGGPNTGEPTWMGSNNLENCDLTFVNKGQYDYRLTEADTAAINAGIDPGTSTQGYSLTPTKQYAHVCSFVDRTVVGDAIDIGAYEYGAELPEPSVQPSPVPTSTEEPEPSPTPVGKVLTVGPGRQYSNVNAALGAASAGDTIEIYADGTYEEEYAILRISKSNITLKGVPVGDIARPVMRVSEGYSGLPKSMGIWLVESGANNVTIENIEFTGVTNAGAAGIAIDATPSGAKTVTIRDCYIHHCVNGIYAYNSPGLDLIVENTEIAYCGGDASSHNIHARQINSLTVRGSYLHHVNTGSLIKSFTTRNVIEYNRLSDESNDAQYPAAYNIEITDGGVAYIIGNVIQQGANGNSNMVGFATSSASGTTNYCYVINNTFYNDRNSGAFILANRSNITLVYKNNIFARNGSITTQGTVIEEGNLFLPSVPANFFVNRDNLDLRLSPAATDAIDKGVDPGESFEGYNLMPVKQYVHPGATADRAVLGSAIDIGAFEYVDNEPPAAITDLVASNPTSTTVELSWTAPGDNGMFGRAASYDIRYSTEPITDENWDQATRVEAPAPSVAGTKETLIVSGLMPNTTYYFAIKTSDSTPLTSAMSNVAQCTTLPPEPESFVIEMPVFKNLNGEVIDTIANQGFVNAFVKITNATSEDRDAALIVALYDSNNAIKNLSCISKKVASGQTEEFVAGFNMPLDTTGHYIKVFVWNSLEGMQPLSDAVVFQ